MYPVLNKQPVNNTLIQVDTNIRLYTDNQFTFMHLKVLGYILSFYVLFCTVEPCRIFDKCEENEVPEQTSKSKPIQGCNNCSPFSTCASCHGFTVTMEHVSIAPLIFCNKPSYTNYNFSSKPGYYFSFFQPPRVS